MRKFVLAFLILSLTTTLAFASTTRRQLLDEVTATGASNFRNVSNYNLKTIYIVATNVSTGATLEIETSFDGSSWVSISTTSVTANGTTEIAIVNLLQRFIRVNITSYTDGTYSVDLIAKG